ncbi:MAG: hypothetical protein ABW321_30285 [Polyangiales bacterium]
MDSTAKVCVETGPCGGDVLGSWRMVNLCSFVSEPFLADCPAAKGIVVADPVTGTMTFDAAGQYTLDYAATSTFTMLIPRDCLANGGDCSALTTSDRACTSDETTCTCKSQVLAGGEGTQFGSYMAQGSILTLEKETDPLDYCVANGELTFEVHMAMPSMEMQDMASGESDVRVQFKFQKE